MKNWIIHLSDLVDGKNYRYQDEFYVEFRPKYKNKLYYILLKEYGTIRNLSKNIEVGFTRLWDQLTRVPVSLFVLSKISNHLVKRGYKDYSLDYIERKIWYIKSSGSKSQRVYYPRFPINLKTEPGVRFIAHLYHDGCIGRNNFQPLYVNQSLNEVKQFLKDGKKLFGSFNRRPKVSYGNGKYKTPYYNLYMPTVIGKIMIRAGYTPGDKTKHNPDVFEFLKNLEDKYLIREYLSKAFNDECHVRNREITLGQATLVSSNPPSKILLLDKLLLEKLGIKVSGPRFESFYKNRYGLVAKFCIGIYAKSNLKIFQRKIKLIEHKQKRLDNYLIGTAKAT